MAASAKRVMLLLYAAFASCSTGKEGGRASSPGSRGSSLSVATTQPPPVDTGASLRITATSLGGIAICSPLGAVDRTFVRVSDTVMIGEDGETKWPAKLARLSPAEWVLFESSWVDTARIWRASTNSPRYSTVRGYRVSSTVGALRALGDSLSVDLPEGVLVVTDVRDEVAFTVDDSATAAFRAHYAPPTEPQPGDVPSTARLTHLFIGGDCQHQRPPN